MRLKEQGKIPHFSKFLFQSAYSGGVVNTPNEQPTLSGPSWTSILTGTYMNKHQVFSNEAVKPKSEFSSIFKLLREFNSSANNYCFSGWGNIEYNILVDEVQYINTIVSNTTDIEISNQVVNTLKYMEPKQSPDFIFVQFNEADSAAHLHCFSKEYEDSIIQQDSLIGNIMAELHNREIKNQNEDWLVLLTTDHGRDEHGCHHGHYKYQQYSEKLIFIGSNKLLNSEFSEPRLPTLLDYQEIYKYPSYVSIVPTILKHFQVPYNEKLHFFDGIPMIGDIGLQKLVMKQTIDNKNLFQWVQIKAGDKKLVGSPINIGNRFENEKDDEVQT